MTDNQPADDKQTPTEEQVKTANELEKAKWGDDFPEEDLQIKYKKDDDENQGKEISKKGSDDSTDNGSDDKSGNGRSDNENDSSQEETYSEPAPVVTVEDPGEYKPADYSFEVILKDGKTKKVSTVEEADALADDPDNFETPKQLMDFINKQNKMRTNLDKDKEKYDENKSKFDEQSEEEQSRVDTINNYAAEFDYLVTKGLIPKVAKEYLSADWSDPQVAKQAGVKEQTAILDYMVKENEARAKVGVKPLTSIIDAYNAWKLESNDETEGKAKKEAGEQRKAASSKVSGVSASNQAPFVPKGIAVGNPNVFKRNEAVWDN